LHPSYKLKIQKEEFKIAIQSLKLVLEASNKEKSETSEKPTEEDKLECSPLGEPCKAHCYPGSSRSS
jgi:hypothetical protein